MSLQVLGPKPYFWQWDVGQKLVVDNPDCGEVHFDNGTTDLAPVVRIKTDQDGNRVAEVPNILLQTAKPLKCYLFQETENGAMTSTLYTFQVLPRPRPEDYVYTETEVLSYSYLDKRLDNLEGEGLSKAVSDYLKENPIEAGATKEEAAQIAQNKEGIENLTRDKLDADKLPEAVNDALAQAKESGMFDGAPGEPGKDGANGQDYVLTEADKTEIAELAAGMVDVPDSGGNVAQGTGWTSEQIDILDSIGDHINFLDAEGGRLWDSLITALRSGQGSSAVLTGITAVYSGGSVEAGTLIRDLKITVTATYDDGTSKTVTGYTTSPATISEGENTVTVTYNGKTSAFNVVGIVTPVEVVLESISAVFNGENAQTGTNASDLDITVTGHYSDGSTKTETGWTTAGVVSEGSNVFTIYLGEKSCTVSVVGVAVEEEPVQSCYTKIARFEGQAADDGYGAVTFNSSLIENNKLYAFVLDPSTTVSAYNRIALFGFVARAMNGALHVMCPNHNFSGINVSIAETEGAITIDGKSMSKFHGGTFYDLYEVGNDNQVITDGQLFDYVGTIEPTNNSGFENTLTIPASAFTDDSYFAVVLRSWNTEYDYVGAINSYGRTPNLEWGYHGSKTIHVLANGQAGSLGDITKNDDGTWTITGSSGLRLYGECNLVYDVYRANPTWG